MDLPRLSRYLSELAANNHRAWFEANRAEYRALRDDFYAFLGELIERVAGWDENVRWVDPKAATFRIHRDTRFSRDRSPYKTTFSAVISERGKGHEWPGYFLQVDGKGVLFLGGGIWMPTPPALARIREHIAAHPRRLQAVLDGPGFAETFGEIQGERLKRPPQGYAADTPMIEHIKLKSFIVAREHTAAGDVLPDVEKTFRTLHPLVDWLRGALTATDS